MKPPPPPIVSGIHRRPNAPLKRSKRMPACCVTSSKRMGAAERVTAGRQPASRPVATALRDPIENAKARKKEKREGNGIEIRGHEGDRRLSDCECGRTWLLGIAYPRRDYLGLPLPASSAFIRAHLRF